LILIIVFGLNSRISN